MCVCMQVVKSAGHKSKYFPACSKFQINDLWGRAFLQIEELVFGLELATCPKIWTSSCGVPTQKKAG